MPEKLSVRMERVERLIEGLADKQAKLDDIVVLLLEAQIKTEQRFLETDKRWRETDERFRQTDERIAKLVSAIGEMLRRQNGKHS